MFKKKFAPQNQHEYIASQYPYFCYNNNEINSTLLTSDPSEATEPHPQTT